MIEGLDDVALEGGNGAVELNQLKHHVRQAAKLTDKSPDLWKTLRVWCSYFARDGRVDGPLMLNLITTAEAPEDSIASLLRKGPGRDVRKAEKRLLAAAQSSENASLKSAFDAYQQLDRETRVSLLQSVTMYDNACGIDEAANKIKRILLYSVEKKHVDGAYHRLEGWWFDQVVRQLLDTESTPIPRGLILAELRSIAGQFGADNLPIDFSDTYLDTGEYTDYGSRTFVQQLEDIAANAARVKNAILDYYQAFQQRSRWVSEELLFDRELEKYERKLVREWERRTAAYEDELDVDSDEEAMKAFGRGILKWVELEADIPIRQKVTEKYVVRGSYHMLADEESPRVHWHPKFVERIEAVLTEETAES